MQKTTELTRQDLKFYKSQRLTDTADGGGMMTNEELTGKENELFNPITDVDNTMGAFDARLVYGAVLRPDDVGLLGANAILSEPPEAENVSVLLAKADYYGQERASMMERIESYKTATTESRMTLLGTQRKGSRIIQAYQRLEAPLPVVGQNYALRIKVDDNYVFEFIRVERFEHEERTFEDSNGEFKRRVIKIITQNALERDFEGVEDAQRFKATPPARVLETQIADSAQYYGIKPIVKAITQGDASIRATSIYEQLVPVSTVETPLVDDWAAGSPMWIETAPRRVVHGGSYGASNSLFLETPVLPLSISIDGWTDDGSGQLKNGDRVLNVDYATGVITGLAGVSIGAISAIPAVQVRNYAYSAVINIDETNVGTEWTPYLPNKPARGSVGVSYMVGSEWYKLSDWGDFVLRDEQGNSRGSITKNGSCVISLPAVPDAPSKLLTTWTPRDFYHNFGGSETGEAIAPTSLQTAYKLPSTAKPRLKPNTVRLTWNDGSSRSAQDNGQGRVAGDASGWVDYAGGLVYPSGLSAGAVAFTAEQYIGSTTHKTVPVVDGDTLILDIGGVVQAGTLDIVMAIGRRAKPADPIVYETPKTPLKIVSTGW